MEFGVPVMDDVSQPGLGFLSGSATPAHDSIARNEFSTMNRKLLLRFTIPSVIIGLFLFAACLVSIRYIHRLQTNLADILNQNVASLQAVQELEIQVRQLRFHTVLH